MPAPFHSRAQNVRGWTVDELTLILLRQFNRLLAERGVSLTDTQLKSLAENVARRTPTEAAAWVIAAMRQIVAESEAVLSGFGLTFAQSLDTEMTDLAGWDTTADFLSLANDKVNAELRISAGSALLALLGDATHGEYALVSARRGENDAEDVDAVIALRALAFAAATDLTASDRDAKIEAWMRRPAT